MAEVRLQGACVGALVGKLKAAGAPEHVRVRFKTELGRDASRATILRHPAVVKGAPRSDVNTNDDEAILSPGAGFPRIGAGDSPVVFICPIIGSMSARTIRLCRLEHVPPELTR
jgi:hypothetical protein